MQAAPPPQLQAPLVHPSATVALHAVQAPPMVPQVIADAVWHWLFWQQLAGQLVALHTHRPFTHWRPLAHIAFAPHLQRPPLQLSAPMPQFMQAPPPVPHADCEGEVHTPPAQHPFGQL